MIFEDGLAKDGQQVKKWAVGLRNRLNIKRRFNRFVCPITLKGGL
jgi:hypothetical protein